MALQLSNQNLVVVIAGCSGSGKSTVAVIYLLSSKLACRFIFDPSGEYALRFNRRPVSTAAEMRAAIATGWVIFNPNFLFAGDLQTALEKFSEWAWTVSRDIRGQKILFVDEMWKYCSPNKMPRTLAMITQDGRKNGIGLLATTQRPNRMNESIVGEATEFIGFRMVGTNKLEYLERNLDEFPVWDLPKLQLVPEISSQCIAQNLRSGGLRRYWLDLQKLKFARAR